MGAMRTAARMTRSGLGRYRRQIVGAVRGVGTSTTPVRAAEDLKHFGGHPLGCSWLGHATTLIRVGEMTVLTDPVMSARIGMQVGPMVFGLDRRTPLPYRVEDLPPIDLILISHAHFDHLDRPTLRRLVSGRTTVVTSRNTSRFIPKGFGEVIELDWRNETTVGPLRLTAIQPAHWGARKAVDRHRRANAYLIRDDTNAVLFGGDTAHTEVFDTIGPVDLAVLGIGAYEPWVHHHATPEQVWGMFSRMGGRYLLPVHHTTFELGNEPMDEPMLRLLAAAGPHSHRVVRIREGDVWHHPVEVLQGAAPA